MKSREELLAALERYQAFNEHEARMREKLISFVSEHENCFQRSLLVGHVTGSAWVVNPARTHALLLHHGKLDKWLQPGGHCDGNPEVAEVALREAREESGLKSLRVASEAIFDVDAHDIPERRTEPAHVHYDVRFLIEADLAEAPVVSDESHDVRWVALDEIARLNTDESVMRMVEKTRRL